MKTEKITDNIQDIESENYIIESYNMIQVILSNIQDCTAIWEGKDIDPFEYEFRRVASDSYFMEFLKHNSINHTASMEVRIKTRSTFEDVKKACHEYIHCTPGDWSDYLDGVYNSINNFIQILAEEKVKIRVTNV